MLTSKEVLDQTGISRATLNNYISSGIVPRPEVLPPGPDHGDAPRIGYFPEEVVARIVEIQRLKGLGWSLTRIAEHLASPGSRADPSTTDAAAPAPVRPAQPASAARISSPATGAGPAPTGDTPRIAPVLTAVAVLASQLDNPHRVWGALPPGEYFELINQIWNAVDPIVRRHHGVHGKQASDGMVCYFFPRAGESHLWSALSAALQIREAMRVINREWLVRKGWPLEIHLKTGLDEGQEWLGSLWSSAQPEFAGLAPTIRRALRIAESAPAGAVWASKSLVARLPPQLQRQLRYGVRQRGVEGADSVVASVFDSPSGFGDLPERPQEHIARGPVTEILGIAPDHEK
ncbi:MAG: adenylate/guanylate cyclase domain-containing protein [Pseudomonadota bacterium]